jgi:hypothetical protein
VAIENFMTSISFDHTQIAALDFFVSGKAKRAGQTNAPTPNARVIA